MSKNLQYNEESIQVLEGLDAVRKRPGMYIGSTDYRGLHHLVFEIVDNSIDETLQGFGDTIKVTIGEDNSITVEDQGRGMPTGMHKTGKPTPEVIMTVLHAGGKFGGSGYKTSGGLHGVGASVVNALSEWLEIEIKRDGNVFYQRFENGGKPVTKLKKTGKTNRTGTTIRFKPDGTIFSTTKYKYEVLEERLRESAFLKKGLRIILEDKRTDKKEEFYFEDGLESFLRYINDEKKQLHDPVFFEGVGNDIEVEFAFQYVDTYSENIISFVNNVRTKDGGTHEIGAKTALTKMVNEVARRNNLIKEKDKNLEGADIREGLTAIVSVRVPESLLQFEGQTKNKLGTSEAKQAVESVVSEQLTFFFSKNPDIADNIINKAVKAAKARDAARKARDLARIGKKNKNKVNLNGKLTPAQSKSKKKNELFIVEGISAGGSAKQGRDKKHQAILPLRGKVINTEKAKISDIIKNEEINNLIFAIGGGFGSEFDVDKINYDKIIIMTDADTDGAHIQVLILTFFFRYMTELVEAGKIYLANPPLYKVSRKRGKKEIIKYAWSDKELKSTLAGMEKGYMIQRYKGLGEMNADQLFDTTMNPETRTLIRVNVEDAAEADHYFNIIMGDKVDLRREWIENNVQFTLEDDFNIEGTV
ncbi:DNA topoisomerase IV subunit B [Haloplasma contractile]|uniref:DNA topoisomerase 4 subunit B n=1 Tax=Haloplasma contractile SSD-17B TaxID=1033810 RepID=U2DZY5_9MOLU|nr:DNA topoisomerase IV subunit B [Haloplasma contractile]ERJ13747.1 DNA topoisomerase IV B subunit protein [Haloplasma contractile SSD-17B]